MTSATDIELDELRARIRAFIAERAPRMTVRPGHRAPEPEDVPALRAWTAALYASGWFGAGWPEEWGGRPDAHPLTAVVLVEELARAGAPAPIGAGYLASRAIATFGSEAQKARYLPRIRSGDDLWCQLFSEPDAGSDLASLRTRAVRDGDSYVIDGQKVWTTNGQFADVGFLLARTDPEVPKHAGITAFALSMRSPGITVRPLRELTGTADFNEVVLEGVRVAADDVIGASGQGWRIATHALSHERHANAGLPVRLQRAADRLMDMARRTPIGNGPASADPRVRQILAALYTEVRVCRLLHLASLQRTVAKVEAPADGPLNKLFSSELNLRLTEAALAIGGPGALLAPGEPDAVDEGRWPDEFLYGRAYPIAGGSNEIMRNVLAERVLGLPRE